jgi:hypothetical protein
VLRRLFSYAALLTLPLVTVPASAQQEKTGQDQQRGTPSADTSAIGREATGIPTGEVDPTKAQAPDTSRVLTTRQGDEAVRQGGQVDSVGKPIRPPAEDSTATQQVQPSGANEGRPPAEEHIRPTTDDDKATPPSTGAEDKTEGAKPNTPARTGDVSATGAGRAGGAPAMTAKLVDASNKVKNREATIEVEVTGIEMVDPAQTDGQPNPGQGHLHYRVDGGPIVATPSTKLSFHELRPGRHQLLVQLVGNDHKPLGPEQTFTINVPA